MSECEHVYEKTCPTCKTVNEIVIKYPAFSMPPPQKSQEFACCFNCGSQIASTEGLSITASKPSNPRPVGKTLEDLESKYLWHKENYQPWIEHSETAKWEQEQFQDVLRRMAGAELASGCFISTGAQVFTSRLKVGRNSWIASGAIIRGNVTIGTNSSVNPFAHIAGNVVIGNGVRIAGLVSIYGFNHGFTRTDIPIHSQEHTSKGIVIEDGTWVGANAVIIDGVSIGKHCVIGAGAVCTKSVPDYSVIAGNPAEIIKSRSPGLNSLYNTQAVSDKIESQSANLPIKDSSPAPAVSEPEVPFSTVVPQDSEGIPNRIPLRSLFYKGNPYADLQFSYGIDVQGWGSYDSIFAQIIESVRPKLIVEVGSWKGASAIHMAGLCRSLGINAEIVCIDTWLGNWQHWSRETGTGSKEDLRIFNGMPRLYYQFMSNVLNAGFQNTITPLPLTGIAGAKLFDTLNIFPDVVYIDGDHEYESVLGDIRLWLKRLAPNGVLIGDDYLWPGVRRAVDELVGVGGLSLHTDGANKFTLRIQTNAPGTGLPGISCVGLE